jgi:predicted nucleotidyltransferase
MISPRGGRMISPNRDALIRVAKGLGPLLDELVFVGGQVAELLITDAGATRVRPTDDVDTISAVTGRTGYERLANRLRGLGFVEDASPGAPICRWRLGDDRVDVMPADEEILGFRNRWYDHGLRTAEPYELTKGVTIRIVTGPVFIATKWEAFADRGGGDWYGSHDIEDIVAVVAGRPALYDEIRSSERELQAYLTEQTTAFLRSGAAEDAIAGALPDARTIEGLVAKVRNRFEVIAEASKFR